MSEKPTLDPETKVPPTQEGAPERDALINEVIIKAFSDEGQEQPIENMEGEKSKEGKPIENLQSKRESLAIELKNLPLTIEALISDVERANKSGDEERINSLKKELRDARKNQKKLKEELQKINLIIEETKNKPEKMQVDSSKEEKPKIEEVDKTRKENKSKQLEEGKKEEVVLSEPDQPLKITITETDKVLDVPESESTEEDKPEEDFGEEMVEGVEAKERQEKAAAEEGLSKLNEQIKKAMAKEGGDDVLENIEMQDSLDKASPLYRDLTGKELEMVSKGKAKEYFEVHKGQKVYKNKAELFDRIKELYRVINEAKKDKNKKVEQKDRKLFNYVRKAWNNLSREEKSNYADKYSKGTSLKKSKIVGLAMRDFIVDLASNRFKNIKLNCEVHAVDEVVINPNQEMAEEEVKKLESENLVTLEKQDRRFKDSYTLDSSEEPKQEANSAKTDLITDQEALDKARGDVDTKESLEETRKREDQEAINQIKEEINNISNEPEKSLGADESAEKITSKEQEDGEKELEEEDIGVFEKLVKVGDKNKVLIALNGEPVKPYEKSWKEVGFKEKATRVIAWPFRIVRKLESFIVGSLVVGYKSIKKMGWSVLKWNSPSSADVDRTANETLEEESKEEPVANETAQEKKDEKEKQGNPEKPPQNNYYETLGVGKNVSPDVIKKAYRTLIKKYDPDRNIGDQSAVEKFKEVAKAYDILSDKDRRSKYDSDIFNN